MDGPPHARSAVAAAGGGGGFSGLSIRRRADNDAGVHHKIHATVTTAAVTAGDVTAVNAPTVTPGNITAVTAGAVTAGNVIAVTVTAVTSATVTAVATATATDVSAAVLGGAAGVWPYSFEDDSGFGHADDALLGNARGAASPAASVKRHGFQSQRWVSVHCGQEGVSADFEYVWSD